MEENEEGAEPRGVDFSEPARDPAPAPAPVKTFTWFIVGLVGALVVLLVVAMVTNVARFWS